MTESTETKTNAAGETCDPRPASCNCDYSLAFLVLRGWLGLRALLAPAQAIKNRGGKIVLFGPNEMVEKALKSSGIDTLIPVHHELQSALAALQ